MIVVSKEIGVSQKYLDDLEGWYGGPQKANVTDKTVCLQVIVEDAGHILTLVGEVKRLNGALLMLSTLANRATERLCPQEKPTNAKPEPEKA